MKTNIWFTCEENGDVKFYVDGVLLVHFPVDWLAAQEPMIYLRNLHLKYK